jgi:PPOX class probable F420-dependent enzyme
VAEAQKSTYEPGRGPGLVTLSKDVLAELLGSHQIGTLATNKRNGHPHLSTVAYAWSPSERVIRIRSRADRVKVRQLARDSRSALHVSGPDNMSFVVAEGEAEVSPVSIVPGDAIGRELLTMLPPFGRPEDEAAFLNNAVEDKPVVIRLRVSRLYGGALDVSV